MRLRAPGDCISIDGGDLRSPGRQSCIVDLRAPGECIMYGFWESQGPRSTYKYKGTSGPLVYYQVKGDLRAFGVCTMYRCGDLKTGPPVDYHV